MAASRGGEPRGGSGAGRESLGLDSSGALALRGSLGMPTPDFLGAAVKRRERGQWERGRCRQSPRRSAELVFSFRSLAVYLKISSF